MEDKAGPLVSVCVTFLNSEKFVGRIIESCLRQTYKNVQVVLVDDASTDRSGEIIKEYAAKDGRVKYHRNPEKVGLTKSVQQLYELADGEYVIWLGVDDWLAEDAIEQGVKSFAEHPDAAAVIPRVVSLRQLGDTKFEFIEDMSLPSGRYSKDWLAKRLYRGFSSAVCLFALFRRKDALSAVNYFLEKCCYNPTFPEELRNLALKKAYAPDFVFFLEVLSRYKYCVSNDKFVTIKILHVTNLSFEVIRNNSASEVLKSEYYRVIFFRPIYQDKYPEYYSDMNIQTRSQALSEVLTYFARARLNPSFFNRKENKMLAADLFKDLSAAEKAAAVLLSIPRFIYRFTIYSLKKLAGMLAAGRDRMAPYYTSKNFLDRETGFKV